MNANGMTGPAPLGSPELQAALDDISLAVYRAGWRIQQHGSAQESGPTGPGPTGPSRDHPWKKRLVK